MSSGLYNISITGMNAAQLGLMTTQHNIANASTAGFNRQRIQQASNIPVMTGAGAMGQGTHVTTVARMYNQFLSGQVNQTQTNVSELDSYYAEVLQINNMLADENAGLSPAQQDFFRGVQQVAADPSSLTGRQTMVSAASALVSRYHGMQDRLNELAGSVNGQIASVVDEINSYATQIADLNSRVSVAESSVHQPANDLMDQRDYLVSELNKLIKVTSTVDSNGNYNVFIGSGQQLVVGSQATTMTYTASSANPERIVVGLKSVGGNILELPESLVTGGQLGGLVRFRAESLDPAFNQLGSVATSMALTFNAQHALGQDLLGQNMGSVTGNFQEDFFTISQPVVLGNAYNTGTADVQASFLNPPPINGHYSLANNAGTYTLTRLSDGVQWSGIAPNALAPVAPNTAAVAGESLDLSNAVLAAGSSTRLVNATAQTANFYTKLSASDYTLSLVGANYTLTRLNDNQKWTATTLPALSDLVDNSEGFSLNLASGAIASGDIFLIQPTRQIADNIAINANIANDPRLIAAAMPVHGSPAIANTGGAQISNARTVAGYLPTATALPVTLTYGTSVATARVSTSAAFAVSSDYTASGVAARFDFSDDTVSGLNIALDGVDWTGNEAGMATEITNQLVAAGSNTVATYAGGSLVFTSGETGSAAIQPTIANVGADLVADGLVGATMVNSGGADLVHTLTITPAAPAQNFSVTAAGVTTVYAGGPIPYDSATGAQITFNGIAFDLSGTPDNGDQFLIKGNAGGVADGRNILTLGKLQTQKTMAGGTASFQDSYAQLVSAVGNKTRQIQVTGKAQQSLLDQATAARESFSGVNLDEEAANLIRYQQAYQASAKMLSIGSKLFDTLLSL